MKGQAETEPRDRRRETLLLALLTAAALGLRLIHLTRLQIFVDEAATWWFARLTAAGRLAEQITLEPTPPLYYGLVGLLMRLFGESDLVMRLPSAVFGAATVPAVFFLGRAMVGRRAGWIAALVLAFHPLHVFYSREARVYPLLLLWAILLVLALWRALGNDRPRDWGWVAAVLVLACYSHFYGLFLIATAVLAIVLLARGGRARRRGLAAAALAGLAFAPYLVATLPHLGQSGAAWSIETFYRDQPREKNLGRVLEQQLLGADHHPYLRQLDRPPTPPALRWASLLAQVLLLAAAVRSGFAGDARRRALALLALAWLVPILVPWAVTHSSRAIFHSGRHDFYTLGAVAVLLGLGLEALLSSRRRGPRLAAGLAAAILILGAGFRLVALHRAPAPQGYRQAGAWIAAHAGPGDRVIATGIRRLAVEHYTRLAEGQGSEVPFESFPRSTDGHPGWSDVMTLIEDQEALYHEARERVAALGSAGAAVLLLRPYERTAGAVSATWLVDRHLVESLWAAGWRAAAAPDAAVLDIAVYRPPGSFPPAYDRGHPAEILGGGGEEEP